MEADSHAAAAEYSKDILSGYKAEAEVCARMEAESHYLSFHSSFLLSTECAAKDEVTSASVETFTALRHDVVDDANLEFDKFKHQLRIDTNKHKARAEAQVAVSTKTDSKTTLRSSRKANHHNPVSTKSTPSHSSPSSPSIPAAVRAAAPSPETITPQASLAVLPGISADLKSLGHKASPVHPAPENTCEASVVHTVMPDTASAEGSLPSTKVALTVPDTVDCGPPSNSIEQMILDAPSQSSSIVLPPSQDMSTLIATINSSILAAIGAAVQLLNSRLSSLESSLKVKATVPEAPYSPSQPTGLWGQPPTSGPVSLPCDYRADFELDDAMVHGFHPGPLHIPDMEEDTNDFAEYQAL